MFILVHLNLSGGLKKLAENYWINKNCIERGTLWCTGSFSFSPPKNLLKIVHNQNLFIIIIWLLYGIPPYIHKKNGALSQTILQKIMIFFSTSENNVLEGYTRYKICTITELHTCALCTSSGSTLIKLVHICRLCNKIEVHKGAMHILYYGVK